MRLAGIDAPEYHQPGGRAARFALDAFLTGHPIRLSIRGRDRFGRVVGRVFVAGRSASWQMLQRGHAWPSTKLGFIVALPARLAGRGLWADRHAMRPATWRRLHRLTAMHPNDRHP
ncbi:thermonuclease family protein [Sphingosinicella sp. BN140058]|uniref:thermonuclease family protein n=1 Tax=Sphingosinicella sp. BN140058 TaxID=1892855 RepID=UPI0013EBD0D9|nr:thermonuclease family protein [Sphingosinicella sp. BN140058]